MRDSRQLPILLVLLACLPSLAACSNQDMQEASDATTAEISKIEQTMETVREDVRRKVEEENIKLSADDKSLPRAEITPAGDLLIGGKPVAVDATQRALLMQYRAQVAGVAAAGAEIGMQGAKLATKAMGEAFKGIFNGDTQGMEKRIEAEAEKIAVQAQVLCDRLPPLLETQQSLATALPEFQPYATLKADDIECDNEIVNAGP